MNIDGGIHNHLRFAADLLLYSRTPQELQRTLQELADESRRMSMKTNIANINVMVVDNTPINANNVLMENFEGYL